MLSVIQYMLISLNVVTNIVGVLSRERIRQLCGYSASDFLTLSNISSFFFVFQKFLMHIFYTQYLATIIGKWRRGGSIFNTSIPFISLKLY